MLTQAQKQRRQHGRLISSPQARGLYEKIGFRGTDEMVLLMY